MNAFAFNFLNNFKFGFGTSFFATSPLLPLAQFFSPCNGFGLFPILTYMSSPMFQISAMLKHNKGDSIWSYQQKEKDDDNYKMMDTFIPSLNLSTYSPIISSTPTFSNLYSDIYAPKKKKDPEEKAEVVTSPPKTKTKSKPKTKAKTTTTYTYNEQNYSGSKTKYDKLIEKYAKKYNVDADLVRAMIKQESKFNPNAKSHAGAAGLMQLMPGTASDMGVTDRYDIEQNINGGVKYISKMLKRFNGNIELALAGYNAGPGNVKNGQIPRNGETPNYVKKVIGYYKEYQAMA